MGKSIFVKIVLVVVILAAVAGLGAFAYRAGLAQGAAQIAVTEGFKDGGRQAYGMPFGMPYDSPLGFHHFGMFGFLGCLIPLFFFMILFFAIRGLFWGGYRGWHHMHHGPWGMRHGDWDKDKGVPPVVEEWHRQMHAQPSDKPEENK